MIVRIGRRPRGFTQIDNRTLRDPNLSLKAKGLLGVVLSYPDDWEGSLEALVSEGPDGRDAIRAAIRELEAAGYICRRRIRGDDGRWRTELTVLERPSEIGLSDATEDGLSVMDATSGNDTKPQVGTMTGLPASVNPSSRTNTRTLNTEDEDRSVAPRRPRPRDPVFDAIATVCQIGESPTKSEASQIGKAKREITEALEGEGMPIAGGRTLPDVIAEEILRRGREAWRRWRAPFSPMALAKHWGSLGSPAPRSNGRVGDAWEDLKDRIGRNDEARGVGADQQTALRSLPGGAG